MSGSGLRFWRWSTSDRGSRTSTRLWWLPSSKPEQARATGHHFHLQIALDELLALGAIVRLPADEGQMAEWLEHSRLGALRIAARIAVACGWDGARSESEEKERFKAAWQREREVFTSSDTD